MLKQRLVFTDLDGTLLDHYTYSSNDALDMMVALKFHDIPIIPNSSKTRDEILQIRQQLDLQGPFIVENGAAIYIPIDYFTEQPANTELDNGFWVKSFTEKKDYWLTLLNQSASQFKDCYKGFSQLDDQQLAEITGLPIEQAKLARERQYGEPIDWLSCQQSKEKFIAHMTSLGANILQGGRFIHVSGNADKGKAQQWLIEQFVYQYPEKNIISIALGDSQNDNAMLENADIAVQIRSPVHAYPSLQKTQNIYQSKQYGPAGWAECLHKIIIEK